MISFSFGFVYLRFDVIWFARGTLHFRVNHHLLLLHLLLSAWMIVIDFAKPKILHLLAHSLGEEFCLLGLVIMCCSESLLLKFDWLDVPNTHTLVEVK